MRLFNSILLFSLFSCSLLFSSQKAKEKKVNEHSTVTPKKTLDMKLHQSFNEQSKKQQGNVDLVFMGDSITEHFMDTGRKVWDKYYKNRKAINMGIDGERTQHLLWRIDHGNLDGIFPKVLVLNIGHNNLWDNTSEEIAQGIRAVIQRVHAKSPKTQILLLGVFPMSKKPSGNRRRIENLNKIIKDFHDGKKIHYLYIGENFLEKDLSISKKVLYDYTHPTAKGYEIWASSIEEKLSSLLK